MPGWPLRGNETYAPEFWVEPSYATGSDEVFIFFIGQPMRWEARNYLLTNAEAVKLRDALTRVLKSPEIW